MNQSPSPLSNSKQQPIEYLKGFPFFIRDENFKNNLLIGSVHLLIPFVGTIVLMGWYCEIIQRLVRRHSRPIPRLDFGDFGHYLGRGIIPFLVGFISGLPLGIALYIVIMFFVILALFLADQKVPEFSIIGIAIICGIGVLFLLVIPTLILINTFLTFAELTEDFGKAFEFKRAWEYAKRNWKTFFAAILVFVPIYVGFNAVGSLFCYFGIFPAMLLVSVAFLHVRWQIYENDLRHGGPPLDLKPVQVIPSEAKAVK